MPRHQACRPTFKRWKQALLVLAISGLVSATHAGVSFVINEFNSRTLDVTFEVGSTVTGDQFGGTPAEETNLLTFIAIDENLDPLNYATGFPAETENPNFMIGDHPVTSIGYDGENYTMVVGNMDIGDMVGPADTGTTSYNFRVSSPDTDIFNLNGIDRLVLVWGADAAFYVEGGMWQDSQQVIVPEPAEYAALFALSGLLLVMAGRRFRTHR
ncbi:hypothetical protein H5P28_09915 [Ruficoccus amylovorans]|uniref:PEP-CTERM protein-sorting domain-containing protein n=1 Tax=Ruficoccus amylovorans TaxID=1804625 RepID=A0A842HG98_9BACT|nr:hypothetical protein [Ruficoccus amylovorans]MBC2594574.1 hypothetical protein [Ruficoccus amylovorans]